ncbi:hypothetical protein BVU76_13130 [Mycolicibacterium porcinum]|nr:hypothetical protein BVU76_13130 [Mycolicibacterium porcinum]
MIDGIPNCDAKDVEVVRLGCRSALVISCHGHSGIDFDLYVPRFFRVLLPTGFCLAELTTLRFD